MGKLKTVVVKYWKVYAAALVIAVICDLIGTVKLLSLIHISIP